MGSTYGAISTAASGLYAQRRGLEVAGQNIANSNTDGYSRQRVVMESVAAPGRPSMYTLGDPAGGGVRIAQLTRFRDEFLEARGRIEGASNEYLKGMQSSYLNVEQLIGEPSSTGVQAQLTEFWKSWHDLVTAPGSPAPRTQVLGRADTLAKSLNGLHDGLGSLWGSTREQLDTYLEEVNTTADSVAQLNESVMRSKEAGLNLNELADKRDAAVLRLAELTGGTAFARDDGSVDVTLLGSSMVTGTRTRHLAATGATRLADQALTPVTLTWTDNGLPAAVQNGKVAAVMETLTTTLPGTAASLDTLVGNFITAVNAQHVQGVDLNGAYGGAFFSGTTAEDIAVAITDPNEIAAATPPTPPATTSRDGGNADAIAELGIDPTGADAQYRQFVVDLGVAAQTIYRRTKIQGTITDDVNVSRMAESGVNLDEEMTNLLSYQRSYEAAAKLLSTLDSMLDTLINGIKR